MTRSEIKVGERYTFFSTLQGIDGNGIYPALYTGRECEVLRESEDYDREEAGERMWRIRFEDGAETDVWEGEIDGWHRDTAQFHGAFAVEVHDADKPADFEFNVPRPDIDKIRKEGGYGPQ